MHLIILLPILLKQDLQFHVMIKMVVLHLHSLVIIYFLINNLLCFAQLNVNKHKKNEKKNNKYIIFQVQFAPPTRSN